MTQLERLMEGLKIIQKYEPDTEVAAEHDVLYCGGETAKNTITTEDAVRLEELGWHWSDSYDCYAKFV